MAPRKHFLCCIPKPIKAPEPWTLRVLCFQNPCAFAKFACISCPVPHLIQFAAPLESKEIPAQHAKNTTFALRRLLLWYQCVPTVCGMTSCVVIRGHVQWGMTGGSCRKKSCQHKSVENSRMQIPGSFLVFVPQISTIHHGNRLESNALHPGK